MIDVEVLANDRDTVRTIAKTCSFQLNDTSNAFSNKGYIDLNNHDLGFLNVGDEIIVRALNRLIKGVVTSVRVYEAESTTGSSSYKSTELRFDIR